MNKDFDGTVIEDRSLDRAAIEALAGAQPVLLRRCELDEANLSGLTMRSWVFDTCSFKRTKLIGAKLEESRWTGCRGAFADFSGASLTEVTIDASDFNNAGFRGATLTGAAFRRCKLTGANLRETKSLNATFEETLLGSAQMPGFSFRKARLKKLDFELADLTKCDFRDAVFEDCILRDASLVDCRFEGADLRGADLGGIRLLNAKQFKGATISRAQAGQLLEELGLKVR